MFSLIAKGQLSPTITTKLRPRKRQATIFGTKVRCTYLKYFVYELSSFKTGTTPAKQVGRWEGVQSPMLTIEIGLCTFYHEDDQKGL